MGQQAGAGHPGTGQEALEGIVGPDHGPSEGVEHGDEVRAGLEYAGQLVGASGLVEFVRDVIEGQEGSARPITEGRHRQVDPAQVLTRREEAQSPPNSATRGECLSCGLDEVVTAVGVDGIEPALLERRADRLAGELGPTTVGVPKAEVGVE